MSIMLSASIYFFIQKFHQRFLKKSSGYLFRNSQQISLKISQRFIEKIFRVVPENFDFLQKLFQKFLKESKRKIQSSLRNYHKLSSGIFLGITWTKISNECNDFLPTFFQKFINEFVWNFFLWLLQEFLWIGSSSRDSSENNWIKDNWRNFSKDSSRKHLIYIRNLSRGTSRKFSRIF